MTTDNILNQEDADRFLRRLGLRVGEVVIREVIEVLKKSDKSLYELYASGAKRNGVMRSPICGKGTAYKIKRLYETRKLEPYLSYSQFKEIKPGFGDLITILEKRKSITDLLRQLDDFLSDWESELSLQLNYLDDVDLSQVEKGVPHEIMGLMIRWEFSVDKKVIRKFSIEDREEFKEIQQAIPHYGRLWTNFRDCKRFGGMIIEECNQLATEIREQSEIRTGYKTLSSLGNELKKLGLDRFFAWTVYADILDIFEEKWLEQNYNVKDMGDDSYEISWGDSRLAIVKNNAKDYVIDTHRKLRATYKELPLVRRILQDKQMLDSAEIGVREALKTIHQLIVLE